MNSTARDHTRLRTRSQETGGDRGMLTGGQTSLSFRTCPTTLIKRDHKDRKRGRCSSFACRHRQQIAGAFHLHHAQRHQRIDWKAMCSPMWSPIGQPPSSSRTTILQVILNQARQTWRRSQLVQAAKILGIRVLDHLIVSKKGYFSFQEAGLIE